MSIERERGVVLRKLDSETLSAQALAHLRVMAPKVEWVEAKFQWNYVAAQTDEGLFVICSEGVGWEVTHAKPLILDVIASWKDEGDDMVHHSMSPSAAVYLSPYEVAEMLGAATEDVDLADFVRQFGDRLESNFWQWHRRLAPKGAKR